MHIWLSVLGKAVYSKDISLSSLRSSDDYIRDKDYYTVVVLSLIRWFVVSGNDSSRHTSWETAEEELLVQRRTATPVLVPARPRTALEPPRTAASYPGTSKPSFWSRWHWPQQLSPHLSLFKSICLFKVYIYLVCNTLVPFFKEVRF